MIEIIELLTMNMFDMLFIFHLVFLKVLSLGKLFEIKKDSSAAFWSTIAGSKPQKKNTTPVQFEPIAIQKDRSKRPVSLQETIDSL